MQPYFCFDNYPQMKKNILHSVTLFIVTLFIAINCFCQNATNNNQLNNLLSKLSSQKKEDSNRVKLLDDIAYTYCKISPYEGIKYADEATELAEKLHWQQGIARSKSCAGANYYSLANYSAAYKNWLEALEINEKINNQIGVANHLHNIGNIFYSQKNYSLALEYYEKALQSSKKINNKKIITHSYTAIASVYVQLKNYKEALHYNEMALQIDEKNNSKNDVATDKINIATIYNSLGNYENAITEIAYSIKIKKETGDKYGLANANSLMGQVYLNMAKKDSTNKHSNSLNVAVNYLDSALNIDKETGYLDNMQQCYKSLSEAMTMQGNYKNAFETYKQFSIIKDSIFSTDKQSEIFNLQKKAEINEKKREEEKLEQAKEKKEYIEMGCICLFVIVLVFLSLFLKKKKVTPMVIDVLCTLSVLTIFELINLLIHSKVERLTHHNLVLTLLCLLVVAALLIPLHHKIEHWIKKKLVHHQHIS